MGEVSLNAVNEATGAVGNSNTYEFSDPQVPTPTSDTAFLRLILHVNGAGQVSLLKSVAIVEGGILPDGSKDILLITDPGLYPNYPGIAKRIASAFYDFGDQQAVTAVQTLIDTATQTAVAKVIAASGGVESVIESGVMLELQKILGATDVNGAYSSFVTSSFFSAGDVGTIADEVARLIHVGAKNAANFAFDPAADSYNPFPSDPLGGGFMPVAQAARTLRDQSFYRDTRGLEAIAGMAFAAAAAAEATPASANLATKQVNARLAAQDARYNAADVTQAYNRLIAGSTFNAMRTALSAPAVVAALAAKGSGNSQAEITAAVRTAISSQAPVAAAITEAATFKAASLWKDDTRATAAINSILDRVAAAAAAQVVVSTEAPALKKAVDDAVVAAFDSIKAAPVFAGVPSAEYVGFVTDSVYQDAAAAAAKSAAKEAVFQFKAGVIKSTDLTFLTQRAVNKTLTAVRNTAAALPQNSIELSGSLSAGKSMNGTIHLPALAPTNPFLHRQHPDHTEGFPITRRISLEVAAPGAGDSGRAGYGVSRLSGTYSEEIFGLHKPLGGDQDVGLRTQGAFTLNRLSFVDSLNF